MQQRGEKGHGRYFRDGDATVALEDAAAQSGHGTRRAAQLSTLAKLIRDESTSLLKEVISRTAAVGIDLDALLPQAYAAPAAARQAAAVAPVAAAAAACDAEWAV